MSTPGSPPVWCFGSRSEIDLSVTVEKNSVILHLAESEEDIELGGVDELVAWLRLNRARAFQDPKRGVVEKLKGGTFFKWE